MIQMVFSKIFISCRLSSKNQNDWSAWRFRYWGHKIIVKIKDIQKNEKKKFLLQLKILGIKKEKNTCFICRKILSNNILM